MSFKKFWQCCFPKNKEQVVSKNEESYDINYTSGEKKIEYVSTLNKVETNKIKTSNEESVDLLQKCKENNNPIKSNNAIEQETKKQIEGSFTSFRGMKKEGTSIKSKNNDFATEIKLNLNTNDNSTFSKNENSISHNTIKLNKSQISSVAKSKKADESAAELVQNSQRLITDEEIKGAPVLLLEEIQGDILKNNKLKINAAGLTTGLRKAKDGVAFFGKYTKQNQEYVVNDFELNMESGVELALHIFIIYYKKETNSFYLKGYRDKQHSYHIQIMIDNQTDFPIVRKEIIILNENYFQVSPINEGKLEIIHLGMNSDSSLPNKDRQNQSSKYYFDCSEYKYITIGRDKKCVIAFPEEKSFSKIHATFNYDFEKKIWKLKDGSNDKPSTNGTWIYATHSYEIFDNLIFQVGDSKLRLSICG